MTDLLAIAVLAIVGFHLTRHAGRQADEGRTRGLKARRRGQFLSAITGIPQDTEVKQ